MSSPHGSSPTGPVPNALAGESSPYLLQHAFNPVAWRPWGKEAIAEARASDRPLFVSIGYATCYWCHVMERESFESEATADLLNRAFVPIKVDREERPDVDDVYMAACRIYAHLTEGRSSGGWPLSVFVDPATLAPFYVGTYFPPEPRYGRPSFRQLLSALEGAWRTRRDEVVAQGARLAELVREDLALGASPEPLPTHLVDAAVEALLRAADPVNGGFGSAPKFPQPVYLELLATRWDDPRVAAVLARALDRMALGGIFDQLAGGFHRYAVDATWTVPHFEKMLYDNAQLAALYARSAARTGDAFHAEIARRTCDWVLAEMTDPDGAFRSALDAEVDGKEGGSYLWRREEVAAALAAAGLEDEVAFALELFGLARGSNFRDPHDPDGPPANVLCLEDRPERLAERRGIPLERFDLKRRAIEEALLAARRTRRQPRIDDKVLAGWNGLMIAAFAACGRLLGEARYVSAAVRAADAIERRLRGPDRRLHRTSRLASRDGAPRGSAFLEDYAFLCAGRIALHAATGRAEDLLSARALHAEALARHRDPRGGCFDVAEGEGELFVRARSLSDGAVPSGNGFHLLNTVALLEATGDARFRDEALRSFAGLSGTLVERPIDCSISMVALDRLAAVAPEVHARLAAPPGEGPDPVRATARLDASSGAGELRLEIDEPWHLDAVEGLSIALLGRGELSLTLPPGERWRDDLVHRGVVRVGFSIDALEGSVDEPVLEILLRPCDESRCLPARRLFVRVERTERAPLGA